MSEAMVQDAAATPKPPTCGIGRATADADPSGMSSAATPGRDRSLPSVSGLRVSMLRSRDAIEAAIRFDGKAFRSTPFQDSGWLGVWLDRFGHGHGVSPFVVVVEEAGKTVLMLPLVEEPFWGVNLIRPWDCGVADYNAPIIANNFLLSDDDMRILWSTICRALPSCDVVLLDKMPARIGGRENPLLSLGRPRLSFNARHAVPLCDNLAEPAIASADPSLLRSLDRKRRKLFNKGAVGFRLLHGAEARVFLERILHWRNLRFADDGGATKRHRVGDFYQTLCVDSDIARVGALTLDGTLIAGCFGTATGCSFQLLAMGFDNDYKNWSPGLLAVQSTIAAVRDEGQQIFDFTIGTASYKFDFGASAEPLYDVFLPRTLKGHAATLVRRAQIASQKRARQRCSPARPA